MSGSGEGGSGGSGTSGFHQAIETLDASLIRLDDGQLLEPVDDITANGEAMWLGAEPAYHDLDIVNYTKYDAQVGMLVCTTPQPPIGMDRPS